VFGPDGESLNCDTCPLREKASSEA
jgi:hypothetical protein